MVRCSTYSSKRHETTEFCRPGRRGRRGRSSTGSTLDLTTLVRGDRKRILVCSWRSRTSFVDVEVAGLASGDETSVNEKPDVSTAVKD